MEPQCQERVIEWMQRCCLPKNQCRRTRDHEVDRLRSEQGFAPASDRATWRIMVPAPKRAEIRAPARRARGVRASSV
ncbi:hypothetical protein KC348_g32 [Hortaea werneckii]|nr:hypothetical protein KC348_g32 [Hortaea werneckii]